MPLEIGCGQLILPIGLAVTVLTMIEIGKVQPGFGFVFLKSMPARGADGHPGPATGFGEIAQIHIDINENAVDPTANDGIPTNQRARLPIGLLRIGVPPGDVQGPAERA